MSSSHDTTQAGGLEELRSRPIIDWHWQTRAFLAIGLFVALLILASVIGAPQTRDERFIERYGFMGFENRAQINYIVSLIIAYAFGGGLFGLARAATELDRLRPIIQLSDLQFATLRNRLFPRRRNLVLTALIGGAVGAGLVLSPYLIDPPERRSLVLDTLPFVSLLFGILASSTLAMLRQSQVYFEIGSQFLEIDLIDQSNLSPFAAVGLMNAAFWLVCSALASPFMVSESIVSVVPIVLLVTLGLGLAGLVGPSRGLHLRLQQQKREELVKVREAIRRERVRLLCREDVPPMVGANADPLEMNALLAYEHRVLSVREWPFDVATFRRFGLVLLIPVASWIGGALVERVVNAALE